MKISVQKLVATAIGIALFVALSVCLQVPVFDNYYLCLGYVAMAVYCYSFGTLSGTVVGVLGVVLYCLLINGLRGMPGWALGNLVIGLALGATFRVTKKMRQVGLRSAFNACAVAASVTSGSSASNPSPNAFCMRSRSRSASAKTFTPGRRICLCCL